MSDPFKEAHALCKIILRNGYDAHIINASLQKKIMEEKKNLEVDIAINLDFNTLAKYIPNIEQGKDFCSVAFLKKEDVHFRFYAMEMGTSALPELSLLRITPHMLANMSETQCKMLRLQGIDNNPICTGHVYDGFEEFSTGFVSLSGLPDETLKHNYLLAFRALRFAANFDLPICPNTWVAIIRASSRILDYVPTVDIMDEWRKVSAESLWKFVNLLYNSHLLHGLIPELASLSCYQEKGQYVSNQQRTIFEHTIKCMMHYTEEGFHYDWLGTMAVMLQNVGKLYTAENFEGEWTFYQHHIVAAKVARKILKRLKFIPEDIDLLCYLIRNHIRFSFMLTDKGVRRFKALDEYPRLIEMSRADIKARDVSYTNFNHNIKYLERAEIPEQMLEPLLNGNEIMKYTKLPPGQIIGVIREALLQAQILGEVADAEAAVLFVHEYIQKNVGQVK